MFNYFCIQDISYQLDDLSLSIRQTTSLCDDVLLTTSVAGQHELKQDLDHMDSERSRLYAECLGSTETLKRTLEMFGELDSDQMGLEQWLQTVDDQVTKFDLMSTLDEKKQVLSELQVK